MPETETANLGGVDLLYETISDGFKNSIVKHEYPLIDGADLESMGQQARVIRMRCYFYNEAYADHEDLLYLLGERNKIHELDHPKYGLIQGKIESVDVRHDDRKELAEVDFTFIEQLIFDAQPAQVEDVGNKTGALLEDGIEEQKEEFSQDMRETLGTEADGILDQILDPDEGILAQFTGLTTKARSYVSKIDTTVATIEATLNEIANPANSLIATIEFGVNLPGRVIGAITECAERYTILYDDLIGAPTQFLQSLENGMTELKTTLGLSESASGSPQTSVAQGAAQAAISKQIDITGSMVASQKLGTIYAEDETKRQTVRRAEQTKSFDIKGNYRRLSPLPTIFTINEIESSLAAAREYLQNAMDQARGMQSLKDMARSILRHVNEIKLERERIVQVEMDNEIPLHLVCLKYNLSYNYAERILSINPQIQNPNFVSGRVSVYVAG